MLIYQSPPEGILMAFVEIFHQCHFDIIYNYTPIATKKRAPIIIAKRKYLPESKPLPVAIVNVVILRQHNFLIFYFCPNEPRL
jgi:hypothetical protein